MDRSNILEHVIYELQTLRNEMQELSDVDLYDRCLMDIELYKRHDLDALYDKLYEGKKLTPKERKAVEAFYILANMDFMVSA